MDLNVVAGSSDTKNRSQFTGRDARAWPTISLVQSSVAGEASGWPTSAGWFATSDGSMAIAAHRSASASSVSPWALRTRLRPARASAHRGSRSSSLE